MQDAYSFMSSLITVSVSLLEMGDNYLYFFLFKGLWDNPKGGSYRRMENLAHRCRETREYRVMRNLFIYA